MAVDLHTHSTYSDGTDPPAEIVLAAAELGLAAVALTDHDTLAGIGEARAAALTAGLELVPGVELSVRWDSRPLHLLVYFLEPGSGPLQDRLDELVEGRRQRNVEIVEALQRLGIDITLDEVLEEAGAGVVGRPHVAQLLVRKGSASDMADAFERYLARGRPAYRPRFSLGLPEAIELAKASSAVPVAAHPHSIAERAEDFSAAFATLRDAGVMGIECHYAEYEPSLRAHLVELTDQVGLIATGGSDYHGSYKPSLRLGVGKGDLEVPDRALRVLKKAQSSLR